MLIDALQNPTLFDHPVTQFEVIETHISWVLLTGPFAYKIKKPVNFGFLDFSTLAQRKHFCEEEIRLNRRLERACRAELRLNRRLAPQLYLEVVTITGSAQTPQLNGEGPAVEYAVKMRQFPQQAQLDRRLAQEGLAPAHIDQLAQTVARFHAEIARVPDDSPFGDLEHVTAPVLENFTQIRHCLQQDEVDRCIDRIHTWTQAQLTSLRTVIQQRKQDGFIRECHGDMHLRNMALIEDDIVIFDCIEFNKNFYLIDVMSEIAFVVMDLEDRQQAVLARRFLNLYLQITGDYLGLRVLGFYKVYRAMVRAKVDALRTSQEPAGSPEYQQTFQDLLQYLHLAERYTQPALPVLLINHGLSGAGKSVATRRLLERFDVIVLRSDVERKRLFNLDTHKHATAHVGEGIYSTQAGEQTYAHLVMLAKSLLQSGYAVIIDAANLKIAQRDLFIRLATSIHCPYAILHYQASVATLRQRVSHRMQREQDASDATLQVLEQQLTSVEPLSHDELTHSISIDTEQELDLAKLVDEIRHLHQA